MKKKMFSLLAVVLFATSLMSFTPKTESKEDGRASDCVRMARATVLALADHNGVDANSPQYFDSYISLYYDLYDDCLKN